MTILYFPASCAKPVFDGEARYLVATYISSLLSGKNQKRIQEMEGLIKFLEAVDAIIESHKSLYNLLADALEYYKPDATARTPRFYFRG